jgi:hypothetical protein
MLHETRRRSRIVGRGATLSLVYVVAITQLAGTADDAAAALAPILGKTPYETRLELAPGMPAVVMTTPEKARAADVAVKIRALAHTVVAFDANAVVSSDEMIGLKRFQLGPDAITIDDRPNERLPYGDVFALLRAVHRFESRTHEEITKKEFSGARALMSGGILATKTVTSTNHTVMKEKMNVLYLFRASGGTPWILRENGTNYAGLGAARSPVQTTNFGTAVRVLRERMPQAAFGDRLLTLRRIRTGEAISRPGISTESSSVPWTDLLAHVVASSVSQGWAGPYRT